MIEWYWAIAIGWACSCFAGAVGYSIGYDQGWWRK